MNVAAFHGPECLLLVGRLHFWKSIAVEALVVLQKDLGSGGFDSTLDRPIPTFHVAVVVFIISAFVEEMNVVPLRIQAKFSEVVKYGPDTEVG